jgi:cyanophycinase-like exopeptidase
MIRFLSSFLKSACLSALFLFPATIWNKSQAQSYTSYFSGNPTGVTTQPAGGCCLMGGASEDDNAMRWFLSRANGGDVVVLRTSGSNGYNNYMMTLGPAVNSVETIVFNNATASSSDYVLQRIAGAEAIWLAGGDQWDYVRYWRNTQVDSLINIGLAERNMVIGGTSAGMAVLGGYYFTAQKGTVASYEALGNPYHPRVTVDTAAFFHADFLQDVVTDTHYDNPDRRGRHSVFLARMMKDHGLTARGIACDEYTAVCIDTNGIARVFGGAPSYSDFAYFIQPNCELPDMIPESCLAGTPLTWDHARKALKVFKINGNAQGTGTFNLNDWETATGGVWENWFIQNGVLGTETGTSIHCGPAPGMVEKEVTPVSVRPAGPGVVEIKALSGNLVRIEVHSIAGQLLCSEPLNTKASVFFRLPSGQGGMLLFTVWTSSGSHHLKYLNLR